MRIYLAIILALITLAARGEQEYQSKSVTLGDGLSQSTINSMVMDHHGYLWIGTQFGLNRYANGEMQNYFHVADAASSLPSNIIRLVFEDPRGQLWVCTDTGAAIYDRDTDTFSRLMYRGRPLHVRSVLVEGKSLLLGGAGQLYRYDLNTSTLTGIDARGGSQMNYTNILPWSEGRYLLVTRWDGLWVYDPASQQIQRAPFFDRKDIMASVRDSRGNLWLSAYGNGLTGFDSDGNQIYHGDSANSGLTNDIILDIMEHDNALWLATDGGGICVFDPVNEQVAPLSGTMPEAQSVLSLYRDYHYNIYAGTVRSGLLMLSPAMVHTYHHAGNSLAPMRINCITRFGDKGSLYFGDDGNGVLRYDAATARFIPFDSTRGLKVTDLRQYGDHSLLVCAFGKGVYLLDVATGALRNAPAPYLELWAEGAQKAISMQVEMLPEGNALALTDRLTLINASGQTTPIATNAKGKITAFANDGRRVLMFSANQLMAYDIRARKAQTLAALPTGQAIKCAAIDSHGQIYFSTGSELLKYDIAHGAMTTVLPKARVTAIAIDTAENLWLGDGTTLRLLQPAHNHDKVRNVVFDHLDGVAPNEFLPNATLIDGRYVWMGGMNGLMCANSRSIMQILSREPDINISLARLVVDGAPVNTTEGQVVKISSAHTTVDISVIDREAAPMRPKLMRFIIEGTSAPQIIETSSRSMRLPTLAPGHRYKVSVQASLPSGEWTEPTHLLDLDISVPVWRSWWACLCYLSVAVFIIWLLVLRRKDLLRRDQSFIEQQELEKELGFLVNINQELRGPLTMIYTPLRQMAEKLEHEGGDAEGIRNVLHQVSRMRDVINMSLDTWRRETLRTANRPSPHDFNQWVQSTVGEFASAMRTRGLTPQYALQEMPHPIAFDDARLAIALNNAVLHAMRNALSDTIIDVTTHADQQNVVLALHYLTEHLEPASLEHIFDKYFVDDATPFNSGLGLAYAKLLVEMNHGKICADIDGDGNGVTITITLPLEAKEEPETPAPVIKPQPQLELDASQLAECSVLVVEPDKELGNFMAQKLAAYFANVFLSSTIEHAQRMLRQEHPDIVVDATMSFTKEIKEAPEWQHIPVVELIPQMSEADRETAYAIGADACIAKPFDLKLLISRCRNLIANRRAARSRYAGHGALVQDQKMNNADEAFMLKINEILQSHLTDPDFSVDVVVDKMHMSRSKLYSRFTEVAGSSIGNYIADYRMRRAQEMLADRSHSINEIADTLGFKTTRYFSTFFKKRSGMTPSEYRQSIQK